MSDSQGPLQAGGFLNFEGNFLKKDTTHSSELENMEKTIGAWRPMVFGVGVQAN
jgi:hypothetical protein